MLKLWLTNKGKEYSRRRLLLSSKFLDVEGTEPRPPTFFGLEYIVPIWEKH